MHRLQYYVFITIGNTAAFLLHIPEPCILYRGKMQEIIFKIAKPKIFRGKIKNYCIFIPGVWGYNMTIARKHKTG
ncbi:MAG: hypothetical protein EGR45_04385 [Ruminococcaceae bacterium]|nr:hypothetical protein [Oscillospiraceae bacterium]